MNNQPVINQATKAILNHMEAGWDKELGGIYLAIDSE
jgi:mannose/cellobiose epimerase-like protein (N-acyl-D-glucosamine 2-epimerase family)